MWKMLTIRVIWWDVVFHALFVKWRLQGEVVNYVDSLLYIFVIPELFYDLRVVPSYTQTRQDFGNVAVICRGKSFIQFTGIHFPTGEKGLLLFLMILHYPCQSEGALDDSWYPREE